MIGVALMTSTVKTTTSPKYNENNNSNIIDNRNKNNTDNNRIPLVKTNQSYCVAGNNDPGKPVATTTPTAKKT